MFKKKTQNIFHCNIFLLLAHLVRVEVVGEAAHVSGGRGPEVVCGVEEGRKRGPPSTLRSNTVQ